MNKIYYENSSDEQKRYIDDRINREVMCRDNEGIEYILGKCYEDSEAPFSWDDIEGLSIYNEVEYADEKGKLQYFTGTEKERNELIFNLQESLEDIDDEKLVENIEMGIDSLENAENEYQEIFEWYYVTKWLAEKLAEIGEPVIIRDCAPSVWGRTCTGQMICLDPTFWTIFQESLQDIAKEEESNG